MSLFEDIKTGLEEAIQFERGELAAQQTKSTAPLSADILQSHTD